MPSCRSAPRSPRHLDSQPRVRSTTHRRAGWIFSPVWSQFLFADSPDMRLVSGFGDGLVAGGIVIPLVQAQVLGTFRPAHHYALQTMLSSVGLRSFVSWTLAPATATLSGPPSPVDQDAFLAPCLPPVRGIASNSAPPKRAFPIEQSADCHSQFTPSQLPTFFDQHGPDTLQHPTLYPTLEGSVNGAVISQILGQVVPLAGATHPEDDPFQHLPLVHPFAPLWLGWVQL